MCSSSRTQATKDLGCGVRGPPKKNRGGGTLKKEGVGFKQAKIGTSMVVQWLRICLPVQGTLVNPWSGKIPHAAGQLSLCAMIACALKQEQPFQQEDCVPKLESSHPCTAPFTVAKAHSQQ